MAESHNHLHENEQKEPKGCGLFDFLAKKEEKPAESDVIMTESKGDNKEDKHTLMEELQRTRSHSSSSSDEEVEEGGERKKKKKKGLQEKIIETVPGENEENGKETYIAIPAENGHGTESCEATMQGEETKGFLEKMKDKLPGQPKKVEEGGLTAHAENGADSHSPGGEVKEKKGILEKIKDKLPGSHGHKNGEDEVKYKEN